MGVERRDDCDMKRRRKREIAWTVGTDVYSLDRYRIERLGSARWQLRMAGRVRSEHARASEALARARRLERTRRRNRSILANLSVAVAAPAVFLVLLPLRMVTNDAYPPARAFVERLETLYESVDSGQISSLEVAGSDAAFTGASLTVTSPLDLGGGPSARNYEVLVGSHAGDCYVVAWVPGRGPFIGVLSPAFPCIPAERLTQVGLYERSWSAIAAESEIIWDAILPPAKTLARWFIPVVFVVIALVLEGCVGCTLALMRYSRRRMLLPDLPTGVYALMSGSPSAESPS